MKSSTASFRQTNKLVLQLIAGIYFFAFASLSFQIKGLCGSSGILPVSEVLRYWAGEPHSGLARFLSHPTIFWLGQSDAWLWGSAFAGCVFALSAAIGLFPLLSFSACFFLYLSFYTACGPFLHFQWDLLLLEAGFLAILAAPFHKWSSAVDPPKAILFLFRFLVFKLMLTSGFCKLASGDATWRTLTALHFHYQTQPLPVWTSWYFHHLPDIFHKLSVWVMFAVEWICPFLIVFGRRARLAAFWGISFLQGMILLTGNYGFFNWLTLALAISLLDDGWLGHSSNLLFSKPNRFRRAVATLAVCFLVPVSMYVSVGRWVDKVPRIAWVDQWIVSSLESWPVTGAYGLFSVMTTERREIVLEGSDDAEEWKEYEFRWKPGDVHRRPTFSGPHMPRLDWQMWFAALGTWRQSPWLVRFCQRLLEGSEPARKLLGRDPFGGRPPKYMRAVLYEYQFTDSAQRRQGQWWQRKRVGLYVSALTLKF